MKKAFTLVILIVTSTMAFAQGTVAFINNTAGLVTAIPSPPGPFFSAQVELLTAPNGTPLNALGTYVWQDMIPYFIPDYSSLSDFLAANPGWTDIVTTGFTPVPGRFNGGVVTLPGIAGGAIAEYIVIGWTGSFTSYDVAVAAGAMLGTSALTTTATGNPNTTPPGTPIALSGTFTGLTLAQQIPETTTFALAGLGAVLLMLFRRRR